MSRLLSYLVFSAAAIVGYGLFVPCQAAEPEPPQGFRALFNGSDLTGWYGLNPHDSERFEGEAKEQNLAKQRGEFANHWTVENGELVNDGHGPYATTEDEFGDIDFMIEYKTVPNADSGIYLRGTPQVQIWDSTLPHNPGQRNLRPYLGSGGLWNNSPGATGRDPLVLADRPFGEWNAFRIRQVGDRTWVWLNDKLVVDGAIMENYWDRSQPLPARGPIMLQTHGGEIRWRNIFVREIDADEAQQILAQTESDRKANLAQALTLHAAFDDGLDADYARGDKACYFPRGNQLVPATATDQVKLVPDAGRFGGALHFTQKSNVRPTFKDEGNLGYNDERWSGSVSVWLRLNPDEDLEPGYCDPVQIVGDDYDKGFIFMEWSKDHSPRHFRYAIRPLAKIWNPENVGWEDIPAAKRPMVQVERAPFSRDAWTHAVFTLENVNAEGQRQLGKLYLNGELQGTIEDWDLRFAWDPQRVQLVLGAAYVGYLDDLAVFDRPLTDDDVRYIYGLEQGINELR